MKIKTVTAIISHLSDVQLMLSISSDADHEIDRHIDFGIKAINYFPNKMNGKAEDSIEALEQAKNKRTVESVNDAKKIILDNYDRNHELNVAQLNDIFWKNCKNNYMESKMEEWLIKRIQVTESERKGIGSKFNPFFYGAKGGKLTVYKECLDYLRKHSFK